MKTLNALIALCAFMVTVIIGGITYYICRPVFEVLPTPGVHDVASVSPAVFFMAFLLCMVGRQVSKKEKSHE